MTNDHMVNDFNFEQLAGPDEITGNFNVSFRRC